jgi:hypothetical protein
MGKKQIFFLTAGVTGNGACLDTGSPVISLIMRKIPLLISVSLENAAALEEERKSHVEVLGLPRFLFLESRGLIMVRLCVL